jgi:hypothetical protein
MPGPNFSADVDSISVGQPHVQDGHIGVRSSDPHEGICRVGRLADDDQVVIYLQHPAYAFTNNLVVIEQEYPDHHASSLPEGTQWGF